MSENPSLDAAPSARPVAPDLEQERRFEGLCRAVQASLEAALADGSKLFATDAAGLFDSFLDLLPSDRPGHLCAACRRFVGHYGGLARTARLGGRAEASACGLDLRKSNGSTGRTVRTRSPEDWTGHLIDRWD